MTIQTGDIIIGSNRPFICFFLGLFLFFYFLPLSSRSIQSMESIIDDNRYQSIQSKSINRLILIIDDQSIAKIRVVIDRCRLSIPINWYQLVVDWRKRNWRIKKHNFVRGNRKHISFKCQQEINTLFFLFNVNAPSTGNRFFFLFDKLKVCSMGQPIDFKTRKVVASCFHKKFSVTLKYLHVAKENPQARTVGGRVVHDGSQL